MYGKFMLKPHELERYDRQLNVSGLGVEGQLKLRQATVLIAGLGGLGCSASLYLAAAGVGRLILVDMETVELSNLNRQVLYWTKDVGRLKVDSAAEKLHQLNPNVGLEGVNVKIDEENVYSLVKEADVVVDGMDNFKTRFLLNEACVKLGKPFIHAAIYALEGRLMTIIPGKGPCLRCLIPREPLEKRPLPVLGAAPGAIACLEAMEAIKIITGIGTPLLGKLLIFDGDSMSFFYVTISRSPTCPTCSSSKLGG